MRKPWFEPTSREEMDELRAELSRQSRRIDDLTSDIDTLWNALTEAATVFRRFAREGSDIEAMQSKISKLTKDVATIKSLGPRRYMKAS
jgi:chromosome segregation ATPase